MHCSHNTTVQRSKTPQSKGATAPFDTSYSGFKSLIHSAMRSQHRVTLAEEGFETSTLMSSACGVSSRQMTRSVSLAEALRFVWRYRSSSSSHTTSACMHRRSGKRDLNCGQGANTLNLSLFGSDKEDLMLTMVGHCRLCSCVCACTLFDVYIRNLF